MTTAVARFRLQTVWGRLMLVGVLIAPAAAADECKAPKPGWSDTQADTALEVGVSELERSRNATSVAARATSARLAEEQFRAVEARFPCLPPNVLSLAESLEQQGRYLEAREQYDRLLSSRTTLSKTPLWRDSIPKAEKSAESLAARIPEVIFRREGGDCSAASVTVASTQQQPPSAVRRDFDTWSAIDPGEYSVTATGGKCRDFRSTVKIEDGQKREIVVTLTMPAKDVASKESGAPGAPPPPSKCLGMPAWVCFVGGGVLVAGAITGTALLLSKSAEPAPQSSGCAPTQPPVLGCTVLQ